MKRPQLPVAELAEYRAESSYEQSYLCRRILLPCQDEYVNTYERQMLKKFIWLLGLTSIIFAISLGRGVLSLRTLNKPISSVYPPKAHWAYRSHEESHRHAFEGISHGSTLKATQNSYERPNELGLSQEYWWPSSEWQNLSSPNYYGYANPLYEYPSKPNGGSGFSHISSAEKNHFKYPYVQTRLVAGHHEIAKKTPSKYSKEKLHAQNLIESGKPKFQKTVFYDSPLRYKSIIFSRIGKPYFKYNYPAQNHPLYKRYYYQSPYQKYAIPSNEMLRYEDKSLNNEYYLASTASPNQTPGRRHTTERVGDTYTDGFTTWQDYFMYNDTSNDSGNYYEESFEEVGKISSKSEEVSHEGGTTRGYYGDRIYMSTHMPLLASDKTGVKNKYFIVRKTSHADDFETLFE